MSSSHSSSAWTCPSCCLSFPWSDGSAAAHSSEDCPERQATADSDSVAGESAIEHLVAQRLASDAAALFANTTQTATVGTLPPHKPAEQLLAEITAVLAKFEPEPIGAWMRSKGWPPEQHTLLLPESLRPPAGEAPAFWPRYVAFSSRITTPLFVAFPNLGASA